MRKFIVIIELGSFLDVDRRSFGDSLTADMGNVAHHVVSVTLHLAVLTGTSEISATTRITTDGRVLC